MKSIKDIRNIEGQGVKSLKQPNAWTFYYEWPILIYREIKRTDISQLQGIASNKEKCDETRSLRDTKHPISPASKVTVAKYIYVSKICGVTNVKLMK